MRHFAHTYKRSGQAAQHRCAPQTASRQLAAEEGKAAGGASMKAVAPHKATSSTAVSHLLQLGLPCPATTQATLRPNSHTYVVVWHHGLLICQIIRRTCNRPDRLHHRHKMRGNNTSVANSMPALAENVTNKQYHSHHHVCTLPCVPVTSSCSLCQLRNVAVLGCMPGVQWPPMGR